MRKIFYCILLIVALAACSEPPTTPEGTYIAFYQAATDRDWDTAVQYLFADTLDAFRYVGGRLKNFVGSKKDPLTVFVRGMDPDAYVPLRRVEVVSREEGRAVLKVTAGPCGEGEKCFVSQVIMRMEDKRWVICPKLPALFQKGEKQ
jgi:hypothetical protein